MEIGVWKLENLEILVEIGVWRVGEFRDFGGNLSLEIGGIWRFWWKLEFGDFEILMEIGVWRFGVMEFGKSGGI